MTVPARTPPRTAPPWEARPRRPAAPDAVRHEVRVWWIRQCGTATARHAAFACLSDAEAQRAARLTEAHDRDAFVLRRSGVRRALGGLLGLPPAALRFSAREGGRPRLSPRQAGGWQFGVAARGGWAVLAVCLGSAVAVDLERIDTLRDDARLRALCAVVPEGERRAVRLASDPAVAAAAAWTRLEARAKLSGRGLAAVSEGGALSEAAHLAPLDAPDGFVATLAVARRPAYVRDEGVLR